LQPGRTGVLAASRSGESVLKKWSSLFKENSNDLARTMTLECGKPLAESRCVCAFVC
jgi:acyl-CoA reductase-like NAD-dependent aldehyde dehydrogenase